MAAFSDFFAGLSVESRYLSFFAPVTPPRAISPVVRGPPTSTPWWPSPTVIVGHAMAADGPGFLRHPGDRCRRGGRGRLAAPGRGRGADARADHPGQARGVTSLVMDVLPGNRRVLAMISAHWPDSVIGHSPDSLDIRIPLPR